jgi:ABC-type transport system involved in multi-copper enzyme maturation permease subunit
VVLCDGSATVFSSVVTAGVGSLVSFMFIILSLFCVCSGVSLVSMVLVSARGGDDLSFCSC